MPELPGCSFCGARAARLHYYSKTYPNGKPTLESPIFCCESCKDKAIKELSICRGGIEGVLSYSFKEIGKMSERRIGQLTAKRGWEINHLSAKVYRDLIFSIHYQSLPSKKEILIDSLNWYRSILFKQVDIAPEDRRLSSLMDCVDYLLNDLQGGANGNNP